MIHKIFLLAFLIVLTFAIQKRGESHLKNDEEHKVFGLFEPYNPKNRTEK